jgi:gentisate 1,2-dioxygenase
MEDAPSSSAPDDYPARLAELGLAPLWERLRYLLPPDPRPRALPFLWNYEALRPTLLEAAAVIGAADAERRVLILENPGLPGESAITDTLFAGLQLIMPGEIAPSHRHSPAALRFILESELAYTAVDGERADMRPGDLILTPSWSWHDHVHEGDEPVIWLDVLDLPLVRAIGPRFAERCAETRVPETKPSDYSRRAYGSNMIPVDGDPAGPVLRYPYGESRGVLERVGSASEPDPCHGVRMEYIDPVRGGSVLPTISAFLQQMPEGFDGAEYLTTESQIFCVVSGSGTVTVEMPAADRQRTRVELDFEPRDIFAIPCWARHAFAAREETMLFSATDRATQRRLGLWREQRGS